MNARQQHILKELIATNKPIKGDQLASLIQVTSRTIRNDLKVIDQQLNEAGAKIVSVRNQGYQLDVIDEEAFKQFIYNIIEIDDNIPVEPEDRVQCLVKKFLLSPEYLKVEDLADELYVSRSTLKNDLKDVKVILKQYNLDLFQRPKYGLILSGSERNIRFAISELLFRHTVMVVDNMEQGSWLLPEDKLDLIRDTALKQLRSFELNISDIALQNLVVHIAIAYKRVKIEQYVESLNAIEEDIKTKREYEVAKKIIRSIEETLDISFPSVEILYVAMHLLGTRLLLNKNQAVLLNSFDRMILKTVERLIVLVESQMNLGIIHDKELFAAIALHLKPAIHRFKHGMNLRNPMLEAIKVNYPIAFEAAISAGKVIEEDFNIVINENEVGYIALHFGAAIERAKLNTKPKRCLIVCTTGLGSSQLLLYKMRSRFGNKLTILGTTELHNLPKYKEEDIDFIVSTVPLPDSITIPNVVISTLLGESELTKIEQIVGGYKESVIDKYMREDLIFLHLACENPDQVIEFLGKQLIEKGMTGEGIIETVKDRERAASTSYGNLVAIPHPLEAKSPETFWTIATLEKPIDWGKNKVQFVCLLHVADENKKELEPMYEKLFRFIDDREIIQHLITATDRSEIVKLIKRM
ncbi:BglG family transcription antiterminator [Metabacillus arenae]|uniref:Transcription antiterminator n=1 Tax=Metabacillus arenae TaxID=2771434 RepID=A0A926NLZ0_9BACI|nr:BglG family transcription antiterminator [Metabacillus arenae]MBD1382388.1 transcription antiterminator [Metabacillus arenae]